MPTYEIVIAGFGGQGILFAGEALVRAAMREGRQATWMPSYGPEQRGGTARCTVVISDGPIASPLVADPPAAIVMNRPSMDHFEPLVRPGGLLVVNRSLVDRPAARTDIRVTYVAADAIAAGIGAPRAANMVALGAYLGVELAVELESLWAAIEEMAPDHVETNTRAVLQGVAASRAPAAVVPHG